MPDYPQEVRQLALLVDSVLEYDSPARVAALMEFVAPILIREFGGASGWGSELASRGYQTNLEA